MRIIQRDNACMWFECPTCLQILTMETIFNWSRKYANKQRAN